MAKFIQIKGDRELALAFDKTVKAMPKSLERAVKKSLVVIKSSALRNLTGGNPLNVNTGRLRGSVQFVLKPGKNPSGHVGPNVRYDSIHETGGTIRPVRAKFLTIPFPGVKGRARDYQNTFIAKSVIFQKLAGGGIKPLFSLKKSVRIPKRPYMAPALKKNINRIESIFLKEIKIK